MNLHLMKDMKSCLQREVQLGFGEWVGFDLVKETGESISRKASKDMEMGIVMVQKWGMLMGKLW